MTYYWQSNRSKSTSPMGSDLTAASGGCREGSEWQRSHCKERLSQATRRAGTATGNVARCGLDRIDTIIYSNPSSSFQGSPPNRVAFLLEEGGFEPI